MDQRNKLELYRDLEKRSFSDLYRVYYEKKRSYIRKNNKGSHELMKIIQFIVDNKELDKEDRDFIQKNYHSYPDYSDKNFNTEISKKAEFFHSKGLLNLIELENRCLSTNFELGNHQNFLKNFMNRNTPYKSLLIFHGVGVGKTCSAVTISNSFIDLYKKEDKKIICLVSKNIQANWMNTIYTPEKGENQCNGESFQDIIRTMSQKVNTSNRIKKLIKEYYEFYGYQQFSNKVKKLIQIKEASSGNKTKEEIEKIVIQDYFSNRVLIIDEIHNLRDDNLDNYKKDTIIFLEKVVRYSDNLRLIIMSATPMFNRATEIQWILNLLLKNDKRSTISNKEIFDENENLTEEGGNLLQKKIRGYVSYVRGENPITFPIRLYPVNDPLFLKEYPKKNIYGEEYHTNDYQFKFLKMYYNQMGEYQAQMYEKYIQSLNHITNVPITERRLGIQISNIVFPSFDILLGEEEITSENFSKNYGGDGLRQLFQNKKNMFSYHKKFIKSENFKPLLDPEHIHLVSAKMNNLLQGFQKDKPKGIIFIYSEFLASGIIPLSLALEHMGFDKYSGNILNYPDWKPKSKNTKREPIDFNWNPMSKKKGKQAKYIILSGNKSLSPNNNEEIKELVSDRNIHGENIKIVIGNVVAAEGLDLKNIREIHILDPWFHLSRVEQVIGRGIRYCSHIQLPKEERNVTVYLHVAGLSKEVESIDTYTYRKAEEKAVVIGQVENILKENAIDCYLNQQINQISKKNVLPVDLTTNRDHSIKDFSVHDKDFSKICSYRECGYQCNSDDIKEKDINYDTFTMENSKDLLKHIQKIIIELYELRNYYSLDELESHIMEILDTNHTIIYYTLYNMIDRKIMIWNKNHINGFLINKNGYYLFQPHNNYDESLPLYYRNSILQKDIQKDIPLEGNLFKEEIQEKPKKLQYDKVIVQIREDIQKKRYLKHYFHEDRIKHYPFEEYIQGFEESIYLEVYLDNLSYEEKVVLLESIVKEMIKTKKVHDKLRQTIFEHFKHLFIYEKKNQYTLFEESFEQLIGFFVMNTNKLMTKKKLGKQELDEIENDYSYYIYRDDKFSEISELDDENLIRSNIKTNFIKRDQVVHLKTEGVWGYPFKTENGKPAFKLVDQKLVGPHKFPGRIVKEISKKKSLRQFIKRYFPENYDIFMEIKDEEGDPDLEDTDKHELYLLIEMIIRNEEKSKKTKHIFIPYDLVFLRYIR